MKRYLIIALFTLTINLLSAMAALSGAVTDIDGNIYQTVTIGSQVWMAENLKVTHYNNGDSIPAVIVDENSWPGLTTGATCAYDNNDNNISTYGRIYNWFAASDARNLAPTGWHVSTDDDWKQLEVFLGMPEDRVDDMGYRGGAPVGAKLKEVGSVHWNCSNTGATNETGFTALPGGYLDNRPVFEGITSFTFFWTSTEHEGSPTAAWGRDLPCSNPFIGRDPYGKDYGGSIRCVCDEPAGIGENNESNLPDGYQLSQNYPNPFNPVTTIEYSVASRAQITIEIFNILGQKVRTLVNESKAAGSYHIEWNGLDNTDNSVSTGVYLYRFQAGDVVQIKKMLLIK